MALIDVEGPLRTAPLAHAGFQGEHLKTESVGELWARRVGRETAFLVLARLFFA